MKRKWVTSLPFAEDFTVNLRIPLPPSTAATAHPTSHLRFLLPPSPPDQTFGAIQQSCSISSAVGKKKVAWGILYFPWGRIFRRFVLPAGDSARRHPKSSLSPTSLHPRTVVIRESDANFCLTRTSLPPPSLSRLQISRISLIVAWRFVLRELFPGRFMEHCSFFRKLLRGTTWDCDRFRSFLRWRAFWRSATGMFTILGEQFYGRDVTPSGRTDRKHFIALWREVVNSVDSWSRIEIKVSLYFIHMMMPSCVYKYRSLNTFLCPDTSANLLLINEFLFSSGWGSVFHNTRNW